MKKWRWSILLPAVHVVIAASIMVPEQIFEWRGIRAQSNYEQHDEANRVRRQQERAQQHRHFAEGPGSYGTSEDAYWNSMLNEYRAPYAARVMYFINLPASVLVGWYGFPMSLSFYSLLWPVLGLAADAMHWGMRIIVLDLLFVATVTLQWWLMGKLLDVLRERKGRDPVWKWLVLFITRSGILCVLLSLLFHGSWENFAGLLATLVCLFAGGAWCALGCLALGNLAMRCGTKVRAKLVEHG
ncbi:MAG TPA: hypothetical protein VK738_08305 [Terriglobales bacterium]|jgi:hypothetical protein|nr:hypothetical protein [Terriglobales bacterium]